MTVLKDDLYSLLDELARRTGGPRELGSCSRRTGWPDRGVYFFFEAGEARTSGTPRVVRVGTHGLATGSTSTLWGRLAQHRGAVGGRNPGGGNHRGSIFRLHVGQALLRRDGDPHGIGTTWGRRPRPGAIELAREAALERAVSEHIGRMPLLWLKVDDEPGAASDRGLIERGVIALLTTSSLDPPSATWLGNWANRPVIRSSGLWNVNHVGDPPVEGVLDRLDHWIQLT